MSRILTLKAGRKALELIRSGGLQSDQVKMIAGAAGGPKWIVLNGIDRYLFGTWFKGRSQPLYLIGSSIGCWRFAAAMAYEDPVQGLAEFKEAYFDSAYRHDMSGAEMDQVIRKLMRRFIHEDTIPHMLAHPYGRLNFITARARGVMAWEHPVGQSLGLLQSFAFNAMSRNALAWVYDRVVFQDQRIKETLFYPEGFKTDFFDLTVENFENVLMASSSIPMVMPGVTQIAGAPDGNYKDGGLIDYHMAMNYQVEEEELILLPHFFPTVKPGWFDKQLPYRKIDEDYIENVLLIHPSAEFIQTLPGGKITDRTDFQKMENAARLKIWEETYQRGRELEAELGEIIESGRLQSLVQAWD